MSFLCLIVCVWRSFSSYPLPVLQSQKMRVTTVGTGRHCARPTRRRDSQASIPHKGDAAHDFDSLVHYGCDKTDTCPHLHLSTAHTFGKWVCGLGRGSEGKALDHSLEARVLIPHVTHLLGDSSPRRVPSSPHWQNEGGVIAFPVSPGSVVL